MSAREDTQLQVSDEHLSVFIRVVVEGDSIPPEDQAKKIANQIWESGNKGSDRLTVFMCLPNMNTEGIAYAAGDDVRTFFRDC